MYIFGGRGGGSMQDGGPEIDPAADPRHEGRIWIVGSPIVCRLRAREGSSGRKGVVAAAGRRQSAPAREGNNRGLGRWIAGGKRGARARRRRRQKTGGKGAGDRLPPQKAPTVRATDNLAGGRWCHNERWLLAVTFYDRYAPFSSLSDAALPPPPHGPRPLTPSPRLTPATGPDSSSHLCGARELSPPLARDKRRGAGPPARRPSRFRGASSSPPAPPPPPPRWRPSES